MQGMGLLKAKKKCSKIREEEMLGECESCTAENIEQETETGLCPWVVQDKIKRLQRLYMHHSS
jgi:hypothetical protein